MQPQLGIRKRFIRSLLGVDRGCISWGSDAASAGHLEEV